MSAGSGTLPADSVRAMFDRIAGVYDVMNTVMTAGLHHRWRSRAADLASGRWRWYVASIAIRIKRSAVGSSYKALLAPSNSVRTANNMISY